MADIQNKTTRADWIAAYVRRAQSVGFQVEATDEGCYYLPCEETPNGLRMVCVPCDCCDPKYDEWHMEERYE